MKIYIQNLLCLNKNKYSIEHSKKLKAFFLYFTNYSFIVYLLCWNFEGLWIQSWAFKKCYKLLSFQSQIPSPMFFKIKKEISCLFISDINMLICYYLAHSIWISLWQDNKSMHTPYFMEMYMLRAKLHLHHTLYLM